MSFFIRKNKERSVSLPRKLTDRANVTSQGPSKQRRAQNAQQPRGRKRSAGRVQTDHPTKHLRKEDEEITSESEDEEEQVEGSENGVSDESETEQEARVRIAKEQISELKRKLIEKHGVANDDDVGVVLREQELVEEGTLLRKVVGDEFAGKVLSFDVLPFGNKVLKSPLTCIRSTNTTVYASNKSGVVVSFNTITKSKLKTTLTPPPVTSLAVSSTTVAASTNSAIHLLSPTDLSITHTFTSSRNALSLSISPETLFSTHKDRTIKLWNIKERAYVESLFGHQDVPTCVDVLSSNRIVSSGGFDKTLRVWKIEEESQLVYNWDQDIIDVVRVLSGGYFVAGSCSGDIGLFSFGRKKPLSTVSEAHGVDGNSVPRWITSLGGVGDFVASGSDNGVVKVWRVVARKLVFVRDIQVGDGVVIGIEVIHEEDEVRLVVGLGTEMKGGRWSGRKCNCSKIVIVN